jgi:penicillin-binding protein 1A
MLKKILILGLKFFVLLILISGLFFAAIYYDVFGHLYSEKELRDFKNETASLVISEDKVIIGKFFAENRTNLTFEEFPKSLINALVATEDARYFEHSGVDTRSLFRVLIKSVVLRQKNSGGGSTITQQLAKNMYGRKTFGPLTLPVNKIKEIILANRLENIYTKEDILTLYLNTVPFGENVFGIEAAARRYYNKGAKDLKTDESAVLIGMLKANTYYNPRIYPDHALKRRNVVLKQMEKYEYITQKQADSIEEMPLELNYSNLGSEGIANYFLVQVKKEVKAILKEIEQTSGEKYDMYKDGLVIETTLNDKLQNYVLQSFAVHLKKMQKLLRRQYSSGRYRKELSEIVNREIKRLKLTRIADVKKNRELFSWDGFYKDSISVRDSLMLDHTFLLAGFLGLDPETGAVKAWVGGIDFRTHPYDQIYAQRQVASTFKPVLYATALENSVMPCQYLENDSIVLTDFDNWTPQNYDKKTGGKYSVAAALAKSMNIPTVNLFLQTPFEDLERTWKDLGFSQELINKPSVALGTENASVYELAVAYAAFANGGKRIVPQMISQIKTSGGKIIYKNDFKQNDEQVLTKNTTDLLNAILQKAVNEGTGTALRSAYGIKMPLAGKTGTSQDFADAWFAAYNPSMVMVTRVGASLPGIHFRTGAYGSGSRLALPLAGKTLQKVQKDRTLRKTFSKQFDPLPEEFAGALDCDDYIEDSQIEKFFESIFKKTETTSDKAARKAERKAKRKNKSFFKKIFGKKEN